MAGTARLWTSSSILLALLVRGPEARACECNSSTGGWPTGRKGVPRTVHPLVLDAPPGVDYTLLDLGPAPENPDALSKVLLRLDAPETWDHDGSLPQWPTDRVPVSGRVRPIRAKMPRLLEFIPDAPLAARHRFALVAGPRPTGMLTVFETGDQVRDESEPLRQVEVEQFVPPKAFETSCDPGGWNLVLREVPAQAQPRLLEVFPGRSEADVVPETLLMSFGGRILAGPQPCSPWGIHLRKSRLSYRIRERRLDGTLGPPVALVLEVPNDAIERPLPAPGSWH